MLLGATVVTAHGQISITRTSTSVFYIDTAISPALTGAYASYQITSTSAYDDIWVELTDFTGGVVTLAPTEDGILQLDAFAANETKPAFFYLQAPVATTTTQSHTINVYHGPPASGTLLTSQIFSFSSVEETIKANANKVNSIVTGPNPPTLGGIVTITVTGATGTIGSAQILTFTPAAFPDWPADAYELVTTEITLSNGNSAVLTDELYYVVASPATTDYTAVYTFRAVGTTAAPTSTSPVGYISSGTQIKHTTTTDFTNTSVFAPIQPANNQTSVVKNATPTLLTQSGMVTYTLTFTNTGTTDAQLDNVVDTLPSSPASPTFVTTSASYNSTPIDDPEISGTTLTWIGPFTIPASGSVTMQYQVTIPNTEGTYTNEAVAHIGTEQIDTTEDTSDNVPATASIVLAADSDQDGIPDIIEGTGDTDQDGNPNHLDLDSDADGILDTIEVGSDPLAPTDTDADTYPDYLDIDADGDGISDNVEAQATASYTPPTGIDTDGDGLDDAYDQSDEDTNDDGIPETYNANASTGLTPNDHDLDTTPDYLDSDSDNDGAGDGLEGHALNPDGSSPTPTGTDSDSDGLDDTYEGELGGPYTPGQVSNASNGTLAISTDYPDTNSGGNNDVDFRDDDAILPVELISFDAVLDGRAVLLAWTTASETNNAGFNIEHKALGDTWHTLAWIDGHGTTELQQHYQFQITDLQPGGHTLRLKQIDYDGTFEYSPEVEVVVAMAERFVMEAAYPNPFNPEATFRFAVSRAQAVEVSLFDMLGRRVALLWRGEVEAGRMEAVRIDGSGLPSGVYLVRAVGEGFVETQRVSLIK